MKKIFLLLSDMITPKGVTSVTYKSSSSSSSLITKKFDNQFLLPYLVCPLTKLPLKYIVEKNILLQELGQYYYKVENGIPILLFDEAVSFSSEFSTHLEPSC